MSKQKTPPAAPKSKAPPAAAAAAALKATESADAAAAAEALKTAGATDAPPTGENQPPADPAAQDGSGVPGAPDQPPGANAVAANAPIPSGKNGPDPVIRLRITAAHEGFRRAGRAWSKQPTDVPLDDLSDDQVKLLLEEDGRMLTVEEVVLP